MCKSCVVFLGHLDFVLWCWMCTDYSSVCATVYNSRRLESERHWSCFRALVKNVSVGLELILKHAFNFFVYVESKHSKYKVVARDNKNTG